ncbi:TPA: hypothetical protein RQM97_001572 [Aeromonas dhakensis]|uniref:hypothetical protein n=1 Tax=Aeromonas dhakensis TaxID=196024 RepID=UPI000F88070B|nr:hypothetical protein [Aeromonas dhakensis]EIM1710726.1 hypothetical protein [Aeromonas dhakensis]RUQ13068.1 hypothetical protein CX648_17445 [Aeromonas dhakensis]HDX8353614.1 hypothetical protein [Aeromonas dhakensis]
MSTNKWGIDEAVLRDYEGFIYRIDNTRTGQYYIGKKSFWSRVKETKKSSPKYGKRVTKESNWRVYQSSNAEVQGWVISDCEYSVLYLCGTKYELGYREIESLVQAHALRDPKCLNQMMGSAGIGRCPSSFRLL